MLFFYVGGVQSSDVISKGFVRVSRDLFVLISLYFFKQSCQVFFADFQLGLLGQDRVGVRVGVQFWIFKVVLVFIRKFCEKFDRFGGFGLLFNIYRKVWVLVVVVVNLVFNFMGGMDLYYFFILLLYFLQVINV